MGNTQTLSCTSGEKSSKAQKKEERYTKKPTESNGAVDKVAVEEEVVASSEVPEIEVNSVETTPAVDDKKELNEGATAIATTVIVSETAAESTEDTTTGKADASPGEMTKTSPDVEATATVDVELRIEEFEDKEVEKSELPTDGGSKPTQESATPEVNRTAHDQSLAQAEITKLNTDSKPSDTVNDSVDSNVETALVEAGEGSVSTEQTSCVTTASVEVTSPVERSESSDIATPAPPSIEISAVATPASDEPVNDNTDDCKDACAIDDASKTTASDNNSEIPEIVLNGTADVEQETVEKYGVEEKDDAQEKSHEKKVTTTAEQPSTDTPATAE